MADLVSAALERAAAVRTQDLRAKAVNLGWPDEVAQSLTLRVNEQSGAFDVVWPKEMEQRVLDQEGGTLDKPARPALHEFSHGQDDEARTVEVIHEEMAGLIHHLDRMFS